MDLKYMDVPIGTILEYVGCKLIVVPKYDCKHCFMNGKMMCLCVSCSGKRFDHKSVQFDLVEDL